MAFPSSNQIRIRNGTVRPINVPPEDLQQLREVLNSNRLTPYRKETVQKKITSCCWSAIPYLQCRYPMMRMVLPGLKDIAITVSRMSLREKQYHDKYRWGLNSLSRLCPSFYAALIQMPALGEYVGTDIRSR